MFQYAFIANSAGLDPDKYSLVYENDEFYCFVGAVHGMEMAQALAAAFADRGFQLIDLCGDFDEKKAESIKKAAEGKLDVCYAKYSEENQKKFEAMSTSNEYGIIIMADGMGDCTEWLELKDEEYNTTVAIVGSDAAAEEAAKEMVIKGIHFIELCSYFDREKADAIEKAIDAKVPVGYCG